MSLVGIEKPSDHYMVLESYMSQEAQKNYHVIRFQADKSDFVTIGRSNDSDVQINDISISRCHAKIHFDHVAQSFSIQDNDSKFGTLVQITKPIFLSPQLSYYLQSGRTIFKAVVSREDKSQWYSWFYSSEAERAAASQLAILDPNRDLSGDFAYDHIGKFCGQTNTKIL